MTQAESFFLAEGTEAQVATSASFLAGGGEMGERIRAFDWASTSLGPVEEWPQSLKTIVRIMLTSRQPIWIGWGPELIKLYNDPYKAIVGGKHPEALGQPAAVVWHEIWDDIGPRLQTTIQHNEGTYDESLLLIMERYGYPEETYYTFSYSPVPGDSGNVEGIICANTDDTRRIIGERQVKLLSTLAAETADARTVEAACRESVASLAHNPYDLPFAALYLLDGERQAVVLASVTGIAKDHRAFPESVSLAAADALSPWPFAEVLREQKVCMIADVDRMFDDLPAGVWKRPSHQAVAVPVAPSGPTGKAGVLIVGLNPFRLFDESYQQFIHLVAGQIAASLANAQAYEEERKRAEALAELDRAKTLFFSNISHEFRTPLTLMLGPIEDLLGEQSGLGTTEREVVGLMRRNALRLLRLVNTLLDFSRMEAGRMEAVYEPVDLGVLTADLAAGFRSAIERAGMTLQVECEPVPEAVYVDRQMWEKIVLNLLSNAFKYTFEGTITVRVKPVGPMVEVSVQDTGVGIPEEELPHMFERFHRVRGTEGRSYEGTGIGLSLVYEFVKLHGGTIRVSSEPGRGSTFTITLPVGTAHLPVEQIVVNKTRASRGVGTSTYVEEALRWHGGESTVSDVLPDLSLATMDGRMAPPGKTGEAEEQQGVVRLLFVDDNADMREYVRRLLRTRYHVETAADGKAALAVVKTFRPALVLTDVMMPGMDGFGLLHALRADNETRDIPVIVLSARAGEEAEIEGIGAGADDYLVKPFSARELLARVEARLARKRVEESEERFRALADNVPNLVWMARADGWIYWYNSRWYDYTGTTPEQMEGWGWQCVHDPEVLPSVMERWQSSIQSGKPFEMTFPLRGADGVFRPFLTRVVPIYDASGKLLHWFGSNTDITEQKRLEQQKDEFISIASHELKTPVTSLKGYTQLLERRFRQNGDGRSAELLHRMDVQINKLTGLVEDLLDVTKIENGKLHLRRSWFDYNALIAEVVEEIQHTTTRHRVVQERTAEVRLYADRERIGQVLTNLLTNAIKYSPHADRVVIKTECRGNIVITEVQDEGIGIPKMMQQHLFERFFRVEGDSQLTYPGLGLGLYISAEFVRRHDGTIRVESEPGKGTVVAFSLPLPKAEAVKEKSE